jgi:hypothetical protein
MRMALFPICEGEPPKARGCEGEPPKASELRASAVSI